MARFRTIQARLKGRYHYPQVSLFAFDKRMMLENRSWNFYGRGSGTVTFRYSDPIDVIAGMLKDKSLHGELEKNLIWGAETVYNTTGHRVFTRNLSSGTWWGEKHNLVGPDLTLVPILWTTSTPNHAHDWEPALVDSSSSWWVENRSRNSHSPGRKGWEKGFGAQGVRDVVVLEVLEQADIGDTAVLWWRGLPLEVAGVTRRFLPLVAFCCQDSPEVYIYIVIYGNIR